MARRALGPATLAAVRAVEECLGAADRTLLIACSGGADSLALAVATAELSRRSDLVASAVVVDHGLQTDSAAVAAAALEVVAGLGISVEAVRITVVATGSGPEAEARSARYALLEQLARQRRATVLLGHTADDQAETVLLGLARGSGTRSLAGMAVRRGPYLRPFLRLRRAATRAVCTEAGLTPWSDPQNTDPRFARVRVRDRVLPVLEAALGPGVTEALARTAASARADADLLDDLAAEQLVGSEPDCGRLRAQPPAIRRRVLRNWLRDAGGHDLAATHLEAVELLITDWRGQRWIEVPGLTVRRVDGRLVATPHCDGAGGPAVAG